MHFPYIYIYNGIILIINSFFYIAQIKNKIRFLFGIWILGAGLNILNLGIYHSGLITEFPVFYGLFPSGVILGNTGFILTIYYALNPHLNKWNHYFDIFFIPFLYFLFNFVDFLKISETDKSAIMVNYLKSGKPEDTTLQPMWFTSIYLLIIYETAFFYFIFKINWSKLFSDIKKDKSLKNTIITSVFWSLQISVFYLFYINFNYYIPYKWKGIYLSALMLDTIVYLVLFQVYFFLINKDIYFKKTEPIKFESYLKSYLSKVDINYIDTRLAEFTKNMEFTNPDITAEIMAKKLNINLHQLSEYFNQKLKCNFRNYINTKRLENARYELLHKPEKPITQIWLDSGFNSSSVFYRVFKDQTGMSPEEYRTIHQPKK